MIEFEKTIIVERPLDEVFAFISDFENLSKWNCYVIDVKKLTKGSVGVGTIYHQTRKTAQQNFKVVEFEPDRVVTIETLHPERKLHMRFQFDSIENGTKLLEEWKLENSVPGPFNWLVIRKVKSAVSENLEKLKILLETGQVILQDGRKANC
jgi:uncharacterized membrane protein